jgi:dethiobiotin synthetase
MSKNAVGGLFIAGTDTGIGKTYVTALIARHLLAIGKRVGVYKPAASGCRQEGATIVSDDALTIWEAAGRPGELEQVCPQRFLAPVAPHLAARAQAEEIDSQLLRSGLDYWRERSDIVLVEGAGGLLSPMGDEEYVADLVADFGFPLILVSRDILGTINQTLSALVVATTFRDGLDVAGVVLNQPAAPVQDESTATNIRELAARCVPPILAHVAWQAERFEPEVDWWKLATA